MIKTLLHSLLFSLAVLAQTSYAMDQQALEVQNLEEEPTKANTINYARELNLEKLSPWAHGLKELLETGMRGFLNTTDLSRFNDVDTAHISELEGEAALQGVFSILRPLYQDLRQLRANLSSLPIANALGIFLEIRRRYCDSTTLLRNLMMSNSEVWVAERISK